MAALDAAGRAKAGELERVVGPPVARSAGRQAGPAERPGWGQKRRLPLWQRGGPNEDAVASGPAAGAERGEKSAEAVAVTAAAPGEPGGQQASYDKDLKVVLELQGTAPVSTMELLRALRGLCSGLVACRATGQRAYKVTMNHAKGKERLLDGFKMGDTSVHAKGLCNDQFVVYSLNLSRGIMCGSAGLSGGW